MLRTVPILLAVVAGGAAAQAPRWAQPPGLSRLHPSGKALVFDSVRGRGVLHGASFWSGASETWEWDGTTWLERQPAVVPGALYGFALAFDASRGRTVLFGGTAQAETWEWDGMVWTQRMPPASPPPRSGAAMAWDALRRRVVLFGGSGSGPSILSDTWEYDGTTWQQRTPLSSPAGRYGHAMAFHASRGRVVLFGGAYDWIEFGMGDTWEWDGTFWTPWTTAARSRGLVTPPGRNFHGMSYDSARGVTVLFGGGSGPRSPPPHGPYRWQYADTWEWNGAQWVQRTAQLSPSGGVLAYDPGRRRTLLLAARDRAETWEWDGTAWIVRLRDLGPPAIGALAWDALRRRTVFVAGGYYASYDSGPWEWDGSAWSHPSSATTPPPPVRSYHAVAFDRARGRTVLFGGYDGTRLLDDTWEWDGFRWHPAFPSVRPPARQMHTLAYDERRARIVLVGGRSNPGGFLGDLWEWDGSTWTPGAGVPAREGSSMAFDRLRGRLVLFGGSNSSGFLRETWERDGTAWTLRSSSTGPLATGPMAYDPARGKVVVASEFQGSLETWEWDGTGWSRPLVSPAPPNFYFASLAQDEQRRRSVLTVFGGTWEYVVPCDVVGLGHAGGGLALTCSTAPRPGTDFCVSFSDPPPRGTGWHLLSVSTGPLRRPALPLASPGTCAPGFLHLLPQLLLTAGGDPAMFCVRLPATPALGGTGFLLQGASLETGACWRMTDALAVTVDG